MKAIELFYLPVIYNNYSAHYFLEEKFSAFNPDFNVDFPSHAVEFGTSSTHNKNISRAILIVHTLERSLFKAYFAQILKGKGSSE